MAPSPQRARRSEHISQYLGPAKLIPLSEYEPGVYLLKVGARVVYVGQAQNVRFRVAQHLAERTKIFDSAEYFPCDKRDLDTIESLLIHKFQPEYNGTVAGVPVMPLGKKVLMQMARELIGSELVVQQPTRSSRPPSSVPSPYTGQPSGRLLKLPEVCHFVGFGKSKVYEMVRAGTFPKPKSFGVRCVRWKGDEIQAWVARRSES